MGHGPLIVASAGRNSKDGEAQQRDTAVEVSQELTDDELERAALLSSWRRRRPDDPVSILLQRTSAADALQQGRSIVQGFLSIIAVCRRRSGLRTPCCDVQQTDRPPQPCRSGVGGLTDTSSMTMRHDAIAAVTARGQQQRACGGGAQGLVQEVLVICRAGLHHQRWLQCVPLTCDLVQFCFLP